MGQFKFHKILIIFGRTYERSANSDTLCSNRYITDPNHTTSLRYPTIYIWNNRYPFWKCHPSGNMVDGLPLAIHDAVLASCRFSGRVPIRKFRSKILDNACTYREIVRVNFRLSVLPHSVALKLASESSKPLDHRRALSVSIFRKC